MSYQPGDMLTHIDGRRATVTRAADDYSAVSVRWDGETKESRCLPEWILRPVKVADKPVKGSWQGGER